MLPLFICVCFAYMCKHARNIYAIHYTIKNRLTRHGTRRGVTSTKLIEFMTRTCFFFLSEDGDTDQETDRLLGQQRSDDPGFYDEKVLCLGSRLLSFLISLISCFLPILSFLSIDNVVHRRCFFREGMFGMKTSEGVRFALEIRNNV